MPVLRFLLYLIVTATTVRCTLSLHDALPISRDRTAAADELGWLRQGVDDQEVRGLLEEYLPSVEFALFRSLTEEREFDARRSEEHTSELQSRGHLVCRLLLEKKTCVPAK